jgi:hypothetical protein
VRSIQSPCSAPKPTLTCKTTSPGLPLRLCVGLLMAVITEMTASISQILKWTSHSRRKESIHKIKRLVEARSCAIQLIMFRYYTGLRVGEDSKSLIKKVEERLQCLVKISTEVCQGKNARDLLVDN